MSESTTKSISDGAVIIIAGVCLFLGAFMALMFCIVALNMRLPSASNAEWHKTLIDADFAEYDRKTGIWHLRSKEDVAHDVTVQQFPGWNGGPILNGTGTLHMDPVLGPVELKPASNVKDSDAKIPVQ